MAVACKPHFIIHITRHQMFRSCYWWRWLSPATSSNQNSITFRTKTYATHNVQHDSKNSCDAFSGSCNNLIGFFNYKKRERERKTPQIIGEEKLDYAYRFELKKKRKKPIILRRIQIDNCRKKLILNSFWSERQQFARNNLTIQIRCFFSRFIEFLLTNLSQLGMVSFFGSECQKAVHLGLDYSYI